MNQFVRKDEMKGTVYNSFCKFPNFFVSHLAKLHVGELTAVMIGHVDLPL